LSLTCGQCY
jgi:hypothetical protein